MIKEIDTKYSVQIIKYLYIIHKIVLSTYYTVYTYSMTFNICLIKTIPNNFLKVSRHGLQVQFIIHLFFSSTFYETVFMKRTLARRRRGDNEGKIVP